MARPPRLTASPLIPPELEASLVLVRHGASTWIEEHRFQGRGDPSLSEHGRRQAELVGQRLAEPHAPPALPLPAGPPLAIWHSPLRRAAQTAEAIAAAMAATRPAPPLHPSPGFIEIAQGRWEGLPASEVQARWGPRLAGWRRDPNRFHAPGGESLADADRRVTETLAQVIASLASPATSGPRPGRTFVPGYGQSPPTHPWAVVVAHDGIFRLALLRLLGLSRSHFWSFPFVLAGVSVVELRDGLAVLRTHDRDEHLAPLDDDGTTVIPGEDEVSRARSGAL
ncbi:MAG TPA: histidine phosphatase family protein [Candidatus Limnocylindrales bacterium]|nr:histidine phosphatase family protein [Candidatus Limnocylindrales bacterium]